MILITLDVVLFLASQLLHLMVFALPTPPTPPLSSASPEHPSSPIPLSSPMLSDSHVPRRTPARLPSPSGFQVSFIPSRSSSLSSSIMNTASPPTLLVSPATFSATFSASSVIVPVFHPTVTDPSVSLASPEECLPDGEEPQEESQNLSPVIGAAIGVAVVGFGAMVITAYSLWTRGLGATAKDTANLVINILRVFPDARAQLRSEAGRFLSLLLPAFLFSQNASASQPSSSDTPLLTTTVPVPSPEREVSENVVHGQTYSVGERPGEDV